jgi:hypothetical protein
VEGQVEEARPGVVDISLHGATAQVVYPLDDAFTLPPFPGVDVDAAP